MEQSQAAAANLRAALARRRMSGRELARQLDKPPMWVHRRLAGEQAITIDDLTLIAGVLGITPASLLEQAS